VLTLNVTFYLLSTGVNEVREVEETETEGQTARIPREMRKRGKRSGKSQSVPNISEGNFLTKGPAKNVLEIGVKKKPVEEGGEKKWEIPTEM